MRSSSFCAFLLGDFAGKTGVEQINLEVRSDNSRAIALYLLHYRFLWLYRLDSQYGTGRDVHCDVSGVPLWSRIARRKGVTERNKTTLLYVGCCHTDLTIQCK